MKNLSEPCDKAGFDLLVLPLWGRLQRGKAGCGSLFPQPASNIVPKGAIRTEELSTRTDLLAIQAQYPNWKIATFSAGDARKAGYILMRDPNDPTHVLLYDRSDPDRRPSASVAQTLANAARII